MAFEGLKTDLENKLEKVESDGLRSLIGRVIDNIDGFNRDPNAGRYSGIFAQRMNPFLQEIETLFNKEQSQIKEEISGIETKEHEEKTNTLNDLLKIPSSQLRDGEIKYVENEERFYAFDRQDDKGKQPKNKGRDGKQGKQFEGTWKPVNITPSEFNEIKKPVKDNIIDSPDVLKQARKQFRIDKGLDPNGQPDPNFLKIIEKVYKQEHFHDNLNALNNITQTKIDGIGNAKKIIDKVIDTTTRENIDFNTLLTFNTNLSKYEHILPDLRVIKVTRLFSDFKRLPPLDPLYQLQINDNNNIPVFDLPAGYSLNNLVVKKTVPFTGVLAITNVTVSTGIVGNLIKYSPVFQLMPIIPIELEVTHQENIIGLSILDWLKPTIIRLELKTSGTAGAVINNLTAGQIDCYFIIQKIA